MDSGLGSDDDRKGRTKEQKQLHNQQLLNGCFIDAANLSDDAEVVDQRRNDERRQGSLLFQTSVPHFSMLQISNMQDNPNVSCATINSDVYSETSTPYNSITTVDLNETETVRRSPLGFYVDLSNVSEAPSPDSSLATTKNIFSMVIDFEGPKKNKPIKLSSSFASHKKGKLNLIAKSSGSLSSSVSSIHSNSIASTSRQSEELEVKANASTVSCEILSVPLIKSLSVSSKPSSSSEHVIEKAKEVLNKNCIEVHTVENIVLETNHDEEKPNETLHTTCNDKLTQNENLLSRPQFVKLSDLECSKSRAGADLAFTARMSRSIPESHWMESPLFMSQSVGYRSAPKPMEPENTSEPEETVALGNSEQETRKAVRRLGSDLLRMFLEGLGPDVTLEVEGHKLKAHKCILASRCQYFAALLSGNWLEKSGNVISLQGFTYESVYFALCHIYSGAAHVPDSISLVELASLADMLGLEGLKEVVEHALTQRHCHNFHRPCAGCCTGVLEVLPLSAAYGLDELYQRCLHWIARYFVRVWPSRAFAGLPRELREKCYQQHVVHMTHETVLETMLECDKIINNLPSGTRWASPVRQLALQLNDACHLYQRQHFVAVLGSRYLIEAVNDERVEAVKERVVAAAGNLGVEQACRSYTRCCKMLNQIWNRPFADLLNKIKLQLEQCLVSQADRLIRSNAWLRLDTVLRTRIKELSPSLEPQSRLPRATPLRTKKGPGSSTRSPLPSSSDSSRNSSPGVARQGLTTGTTRMHGAPVVGSPSLRRSLLLAAKSPQQPAGSTLTKPTAASAAKAVITTTYPKVSHQKQQTSVSKVNTSETSVYNTRTFLQSSTTKQPASKKNSTTVSRNSSLGKKDTPSLANKKSTSRSSSPLKSYSRVSSPRKLDSTVTSPINVAAKTPVPIKETASSRKLKSASSSQTKPTLQRSSTFLKDEPTILHKII